MAIRSRSVAALVAAAALLAGCGGGGGGGAADTGANASQGREPAENPEPQSKFSPEAQLAYQTAIQQCSYFPFKEVASTRGVPATPKAVSEAVAKEAGSDPELREAARQGCLAGLKQTGE